MNNSNRTRNLYTFHKAYYGDIKNKNLQKNFKYLQLPYWMNSYGKYLKFEFENKTPKYYKRFKQGTVIMTDFGVNVGAEMSGKHFAVVINSDDDKYKKTLTVIPLTSKFHNGHVSLGAELFSETINLATKKRQQVLDEINKSESIHNSIKNQSTSSLTKITKPEDIQLMKKVINVKAESSSALNSDNLALSQIVTNLNSLKEIDDHPDILKLSVQLSDYLQKIKDFEQQISDNRRKMAEELTLISKLRKYNNNTFADVSGITTISKLRSVKISEFTISGNVKLSDNSINKIKEALIKKI